MADPETGLFHLAKALRAMRQQRGHTQAALAKLAGLPRLKIVQIEAGRGGVSMAAYMRVAAAMGGELYCRPQSRPTMDEIRELIGDGNG